MSSPHLDQTNSQRHQLRTQIRHKRQALNAQQQVDASQQLVKQLVQQYLTCAELKDAQHIAIYLSNDGELDTTPLIQHLWQQGKQTYLPVLHPFAKGHLLFLAYTPETKLIKNKYGILEPTLNMPTICPVAQLDIIFTPLVAFDSQGYRLGMGGGYYDRTLAPWFTHQQGAIPIGLAHDCQYIPQLPIACWDVPLAKIITPSKIWDWENSHSSL